MLNENDKDFLNAFAYNIIEKFAHGEQIGMPERLPQALRQEKGVVCRITMNGTSQVIGNPYPMMSIIDGVISAITSFCTEHAISEKDLTKKITAEICITSEPQLIDIKMPSDYNAIIDLKREGLMMEYGPYLIMDIPAHSSSNIEGVLGMLCEKANMSKTMWKSPDARVYRFEAEKV